jgi:DedD protein
MDHELKQRLIGAVVVTALAAIFIPMLFDDPVDTSGTTVTELKIPQAPVEAAPEAAANLPDNKEQVLERRDIELNAAEVNDDNQADGTVQAPIGSVPDGEQTEQPGLADTVKGTAPGTADEPSGDGLSTKQDGQTGSGLDTGYVPGAHQAEESQGNTTEPVKKTEQDLAAPVKKSVARPIPDKPKTKPESTVEKVKSTANSQDEQVKKSSSKLVRYSIQAGSFNKKENAQTLVDKLRKQGMPASIVTKGDYYRVKIGPALDKQKAKDMKAKLDKQNIKGLLVSE